MVLLYYFIIFLFGLCVGSFLSAYTWRWPRGISISEGRSICPKCRKNISWFDNIPLLSYIILNGKCRSCGNKISFRYPLIELSTGVIFVLIFSLLGGISFILSTFYLLLTIILIAIFIIDLENKVIPDELVFTTFTLSIFMLIITSNSSFYETIFTAFFATSFFLFLNFITKGRGMGLGDAKLVLALSPILGYPGILIWLSLSFIIGAVIGLFLIALKKAAFGRQIPFGPFLIASFFITLFWGDWILKTFFLMFM